MQTNKDSILIQTFYDDVSTAEFKWHENRYGTMVINDGTGRKVKGSKYQSMIIFGKCNGHFSYRGWCRNGEITMNGMQNGILEEAALTYFEVLSRHSLSGGE